MKLNTNEEKGTAVAQWLRRCATNRKVAGSTCYKDMREWRYSSTHSSHRHWMYVSKQLHITGYFKPGKGPPVIIKYDVVGPQRLSKHCRE